MRVQRAKKEHYHQDLWNDYLASTHLVHHAIKARSESQSILRVAHVVVEQRHESLEGIGDRFRATVEVQSSKHLKSLSIIHQIHMLEYSKAIHLGGRP